MRLQIKPIFLFVVVALVFISLIFFLLNFKGVSISVENRIDFFSNKRANANSYGDKMWKAYYLNPVFVSFGQSLMGDYMNVVYKDPRNGKVRTAKILTSVKESATDADLKSYWKNVEFFRNPKPITASGNANYEKFANYAEFQKNIKPNDQLTILLLVDYPEKKNRTDKYCDELKTKYSQDYCLWADLLDRYSYHQTLLWDYFSQVEDNDLFIPIQFTLYADNK